MSDNEKRRIENMEAALHAYRVEAQDLRAALAAEQLRRESAEKVVDAALAQNKNGLMYERADIHRSIYPKDSKDIKEGGK